MKTVYKYIADLKDKKGIESDYAIAKYLGITKASLSAIKNGGSVRDETALKIADELGIDPEEIIFVATAQRTKNPRVKKVWEKISKISGIAASLLLATEAVNSTLLHGMAAVYESIKCILC